MSTKHTPGPWRVDWGTTWHGILSDHRAPANYQDKNIGRVAQLSIKLPENKANARLIAAAPEMLECLKHTYELLATLAPLQTVAPHLQLDVILPIISSIIAKAEGSEGASKDAP